MALGIRLVNESKFILGAIFISTILILNPLAAFADGNGSPPECLGPDAKVEDPPGVTASHDAGAGKKVSGLCIKTGTTAFAVGPCANNDKHSCLLQTLGTFNAGLNNCYEVTGIGTQVASVTQQPGNPPDIICKDISHVDFFEMDLLPPASFAIGGEFIGIDTTAVLSAGAQYTAAWMIPVLVSTIGIGIVIARKF